MCVRTPRVPEMPTPPPPAAPETIDEQGQVASDRERRRAAARAGRQSTILAGQMPSGGVPATSGVRTLLGG